MGPERDLFANFERMRREIDELFGDEKALAAQRAEIVRVVAPRRNEGDLDEFPPNLLRGMQFLFADTVDDVLASALD